MKFDDETVIRRAPTALSRAFEHEVAVILPSASAVRVLNEVGARIWTLADGRTLSQILDVLVNEYDVERTQLRVDAEAFLTELQGRGLLETPPGP
jgi:coenzyme PQQ synthesis protein D (PqqD)